MTLAQRSEVVDAVWPEPMDLATRLVRCALVAAIEAGDGTPTLSQKERTAIEAHTRKVRPQHEGGAPA